MHRGSGLLAGWGGASAYLFVGEFEAMENAASGTKILAETEYGMWARPRPTSEPAGEGVGAGS
jgi:hypothetical protein